MDFPPLDDIRWDRLLGAVTGQRPTVAGPDAPLAAWFPSVIAQEEPDPAEPEPWRRTIVLDAYA